MSTIFHSPPIFIEKQTAISAATKTKISYNVDGVITAGTDATTADISDSTDKRYCTDAEKTILTNQATMITLKACASMLDDASIALPACPNGGLFKAWTEAEYMEVQIRADGSIEYIRKTANCDTADTDGMLCVFDDGTNGKLRNRRGSTKVVSYILEYGVI